MIALDEKPDRNWIDKISSPVASSWGVIPHHQNSDGAVVVLMRDADDLEVLENLKILLSAAVKPVVVSELDFEKALQTHYGLGANAINDLPESDLEIEPHSAEIGNDDAAIGRFVTQLLLQAHQDRATDIHIEPFDDDLLVRFRIDGLLHPISVPPSLKKFRALLSSRIKLLGHMNIAEKRLPQDGRIRFQAGEEDLDIRVSTVPTIHGESIDLRLLPRTRLVLGLEQLGMAPDTMKVISRLIRRPNGIFLVTGPTGHGKTTTLYACLSQINTPEKKIITIEDPVEVRLKGVNQMQTHPKIGLTFAHSLRSVLRQDPDVIMVGEIRDRETADIAVRASLTGHLVCSTLHTNDALGAVTRLVDMGIEPYLVASSLNGVLAQRLIRKICSGCGGNNKACEKCRGTGYYGRTGLFEFFEINEDMRNLISNRAAASLLREKALSSGMKTLGQDGQQKIKAGLTTREEVLRVTEDF